MKKILIAGLATCLLFASCQKKESATPEADPEIIPGETVQRGCATEEVFQANLAEDPSLQSRMDQIETFTKKFIESKDNSGGNNEFNRLVNGVIEIPVVVHVIYNLAVENISAAQVQSQIDVLNEDFNNTNADGATVPGEFQDERASIGVRFVLDRIIRKHSTKKWMYNNNMKYTSKGGSDVVDPAHYLNLWVVNKINNGQSYLFGFGQYPGGNPETDGIVIAYKYVGRTGTVAFPYDKGRTGTHEVGHWMNLRHIWGDATCGTDLVDDTPQHNAANYGCPVYPDFSTCAGRPVEMTMNYMDYSDDGCVVMFTNGQKSRALAIFASGGPRATFAQ